MSKLKKRKRNIVIAFIFFILSFAILGILFIDQNFIFHQPKIEVENIILPLNKDEVDPKLVEIQKLYEENNDLIGWLKIEDTKIDYPVMFTRGEDYYLRRDFYKKKSTAGSLFIDKYQDMSPKDINILIHGHNMNNGTMFHDLLNYKKKAYYEAHKNIIYYTLEEKQEYEIIAVFLSKVYNVSDTDFKYYKFYGKQEEDSYKNYIENIKKLSLYDIKTTAIYPEELITLSTCEYSEKDGRLVVVAKRVS